MTARALAALALAAGCGGVSTPDLSAGEVSGRIVVADAARAQVYVVGAPERGGAVAADGSYALSGVPAGAAVPLFFYDGGDRAGVAAVRVEGARRVRHDVPSLPLAVLR